MAYKIQHLGLGGILDQSISICKDHFGLLFKIMLIIYIPFVLAMGFVTAAIVPQAPAGGAMGDMQRANEVQIEAMTTMWPIFLSMIVLSIVVMPVTNAAVIQAVARLYLGEQVTALEAVKHGFKRYFPLIWTSILMMLAIYIGMILCVIPGLICMVIFGLSQDVVVIEGISGFKALGRSKKLVSGDWMTFVALGLIMFVISAALNWSAQLIPEPNIGVVVGTLMQAITTILWTAAFVVFYFSARCGIENFDLHHLAQAIGEDLDSVGGGGPTAAAGP